jgi:hypothetical protein
MAHTWGRTVYTAAGKPAPVAQIKFDRIQLKSKGFALKLCTDQIRPDTNLFLKIHRLVLTQAPGKSDRSKNEKSKNSERKSQIKLRNPRGHKEDLGLHSHSKSQQNTPRKSQLM